MDSCKTQISLNAVLMKYIQKKREPKCRLKLLDAERGDRIQQNIGETRIRV